MLFFDTPVSSTGPAYHTLFDPKPLLIPENSEHNPHTHAHVDLGDDAGSDIHSSTVGVPVTLWLPIAAAQTIKPVPTATAPVVKTSTPHATASHTPTPLPAKTQPPATATPAAGATPTPLGIRTPTPAPCPASAIDNAHWHPAIDPSTGCAWGHSHFGAPPAWLTDWLGQRAHGPHSNTPHFDHVMNTSALENTLKHPCMKGFHLGGATAGEHGLLSKQVDIAYPGWELYAIYHGCANPPDRLARFHSLQWWIKDPTGTISYARHWIDAGDTRYFEDAPLAEKPGRIESRWFDIFPYQYRPLMRVDWGCDRDLSRTSPDCTQLLDFKPRTICEQWYMLGGDVEWLPETAVTICDTPTAYSDIERIYARGLLTETALLPPLYDASWWPKTGGTGSHINFELVMYASRIQPYVSNTPFWHDQFGNIMRGEQDARCGQPVMRSGTEHIRLCSEAYLAPSLHTEMEKLYTFSQGQFAPREVQIFDARGVDHRN
jgi:hypothetical protein